MSDLAYLATHGLRPMEIPDGHDDMMQTSPINVLPSPRVTPPPPLGTQLRPFVPTPDSLSLLNHLKFIRFTYLKNEYPTTYWCEDLERWFNPVNAMMEVIANCDNPGYAWHPALDARFRKMIEGIVMDGVRKMKERSAVEYQDVPSGKKRQREDQGGSVAKKAMMAPYFDDSDFEL
ncbi:hypothetical protein HDU97_005197 [Phlyctochytrium planicorne]|nr:hypothetical protein HDU97_005197 [Phlyctochytrium planicorne]